MQVINDEEFGATRPALTQEQLDARNRYAAQHRAEVDAFSNLTPDQLAKNNNPPTWMDVYNVFNNSHVAKYGIPMNRAWSDNAGDAKTAHRSAMLVATSTSEVVVAARAAACRHAARRGYADPPVDR